MLSNHCSRFLVLVVAILISWFATTFLFPNDADSKPAMSPGEQLTAELSGIEQQAARSIAAENPGLPGLKAALQSVQTGLEKLSSGEGLRLSRGDSSLEDLRPVLMFRLAALHARLGNKKEAFQTLDEILLELPRWLRDELSKSAAFASLAEDPEFQRMKTRLERAAALWDGAAFGTPFKENLSEDEKVAGLSFFWSEVKSNFMKPSRLVEVNWDGLYMSYLPRVRATQSTFEYYRVLQEMCAQLQDGHTQMFMPLELYARQASVAGLDTALIEDRVIVLSVDSEFLRNQGIRPGQEIVSIDGIPVRKYAEERIAPFQCASTPQDRAWRTYSAQPLTTGPKDVRVELELKTADGNSIRTSVPREAPLGPPNIPLIEARILDGNIAHVILNSLNNPQVVSEFRKIFEDTIQRADGLIIDIRNNGGGNSWNGYQILNYLTNQPYLTSKWKSRSYCPTFRSWGKGLQWRVYPAEENRSDCPNPFTKPVALLTGPRTYSAAEDFCVAFRNAGRGKIIGEPTGGSTGNPLMIKLPGGGTGIICTKLDSFPDGSPFVGVGIQPDILVPASVEDIRSGVDRVLKVAVETVTRKSPSE